MIKKPAEGAALAGVLLLTFASLPAFGQDEPLTLPPLSPAHAESSGLGQGQPLTLPPLSPCRAQSVGCPAAAAARGGQTATVTMPPMMGDTLALALTADAFKIGENESPRPLDRVFTTFDYFHNEVPAQFHKQGLGQADVYRELFGLEKTFLDGDASLGFRLPLDTLHVARGTFFAGGSSTDPGDLSIILKYAFMNDPCTGKVLSVGLVVTAPTGPANFAGFDQGGGVGGTHDTLLQPFLGGIYPLGDWYVHGFSSVAAATDPRHTTVLFKDLGVGYWLYRNGQGERPVTAVVPTAEVHVTTPWNRHGTQLVDAVDLTQGVNFELYRRAWLTVGVSENVTGPKTYDTEALAQLNFRF